MGIMMIEVLPIPEGVGGFVQKRESESHNNQTREAGCFRVAAKPAKALKQNMNFASLASFAGLYQASVLVHEHSETEVQ